MNNVLGGNVDDDRTGFAVRVLDHWHVDVVENLRIVLSFWIAWIDAEHIRFADKTHVLPAEFPVLAWVANVPGELLSDHLENGGFFWIEELINDLSPKGYRYKD